MKNLENRVIIITGAAMGLGLPAAKELAASGAILTLVDYNEKSLLQSRREARRPLSHFHEEANKAGW